MAKSRRQAKLTAEDVGIRRRVQYGETSFDVIDTGIYEVATAIDWGDVNLHERVSARTKAKKITPASGERSGGGLMVMLLGRTASRAAALLRPHVAVHHAGAPVPEGRRIHALELGDGHREYLLPDPIAHSLFEAVVALSIVHDIRTNPMTDLEQAFVEGFVLGEYNERFFVREREHVALKGKLQRARAIAAGKTREKLTDEQRARVKSEIRELTTTKRLSMNDACQCIADRFEQEGVSIHPRTLARHYKKP